jgi:predicted metal-binding membrane protein
MFAPSLGLAVRRDRVVVSLGLAMVALLAWAYMIVLARQMSGMAPGASTAAEMSMPVLRPWGASDVLLTFVMWTVMMVAMMIPSAAGMVLAFAAVQRQRHERSLPYTPTGLFLLGYLVLWSVYSLAATLLQWGLHDASLLTPMMAAARPVLGGGLLVLAGIYQFTPLKYACLSKCRSPLGFLLSGWRDGRWGALIMGFQHGTECVACCWVLMLLLFVAGLMNLLWVAVIAGYVLVEKVAPAGHRIARVMGALSILWGIGLLVAGLL